MPKTTCGNGSPTTTFGAPTGDKEFKGVSPLSVNDGTKLFELEGEMELLADPENTHIYWLTWEQTNSFSQYHIRSPCGSSCLTT